MEWRVETLKKNTLIIVSIFCLALLGASLGVMMKSTLDMRHLLEESVKAQLISTCEAALGIVDDYDYLSYTSAEAVAADAANYQKMVRDLQTLAKRSGAKYIYGLRMIDDEATFFIDIDEEDNQLFQPYELSDVHRSAFYGHSTAGIFNMVDEYGSFNTGAIPIMNHEIVVGIIAVDIEDDLITASYEAANRNIALLIAVLALVMVTLLLFMNYLMHRIRKMQDELQRMAHYDTVTGLPNRQYLFDYLSRLVKGNPDQPFALIFIDLDNFKLVNDHAGHDAGDALLRSIGEFLQGHQPVVQSFRPTAGALNVSARVGGDEFVQVAPGMANEEQALEFVNQMLRDFAASGLNRHIQEYAVGMSIGVALYPYHSKNFNVLIKYADIAMYHAKNGGKNRAVMYNEGLAPKEEK